MKNSVLKLVKWFCRRLTLNEFHSALTIMHEVLNSERHDIEFKPEAKPPHYRNFRVDMEPPLTEAPAKNIQSELSWQQLKRKYKQKHGTNRRKKAYNDPIHQPTIFVQFL